MTDLFVLIWIDDCLAAIPAIDVEAVIELEHIYAAPLTSPCVVGISSVRSMPITVIDSRAVLGRGTTTAIGEQAPLIKRAGHLYALVVDRIEGAAQGHAMARKPCCPLGTGWADVTVATIETDIGTALVIDVDLFMTATTAKAV